MGLFKQRVEISMFVSGGFRGKIPGVSGGFRGFPGVSGLIPKTHTYETIHLPSHVAGFPPAELDKLKLKKGTELATQGFLEFYKA